MTKKFQHTLLQATLLELFIGGNGYLLEIGGVRLRVLLYVVCLAWVIFTFLTRPLTSVAKSVWLVLGLFLASTLIGVVTALSSGISLAYIFAELKGLLYFPMIMFFALAIRDREDVELAAKLIVVCAVLQSTIFVGLMVQTHLGILQYQSVYEYLRQSDEFIFRHVPEVDDYYFGFFYKGAFHLGVAGLFLLFVPKLRNYVFATLVLIALVLTETRGLYLSFGLAVGAGIMLLRNSAQWLVLSVVCFIVVVIVVTIDVTPLFLRPVSDSQRIDDIKWIAANFDIQRILVGHSMGAFIGERNRIEMTYLEIFYKQGLLGFMPWIAIFTINFIAYLEIRSADTRLGLAFLLSMLYVYLATATNTFLTGSIGMCIVLISTVSLHVLRKSPRRASAIGVTHA